MSRFVQMSYHGLALGMCLMLMTGAWSVADAASSPQTKVRAELATQGMARLCAGEPWKSAL
jgi:hypothetical protein